MTLGEKLKDARKNAGLSQEQLAEKLCVSRAAVAKWETDKGMPDIMNLKAIAKLLDISIDYLVDDGMEMDFRVTKEPVRKESFEITGRYRTWQDAAVMKRFPDATRINQVALIHQLNKIEWWADFLTLGLYTMIWGISHWKTWTGCYFMVEQGSRQFFVSVDEEFMTTTALPNKIENNIFYIGDRQCIRIHYELVQQ